MATRELPMFPLGSVLLPGMPLPLRVFEPRYVALVSDVLGRSPSEFGVVLIERGSEVGGGDARFGVGTVARIESVQLEEGSILLLARGGARVRVDGWLTDDPYPLARVHELAPLDLDAGDLDALADAERVVRETLAKVSEFAELRWPADTPLAEDPGARLWQLVGIAPIGPLDQQAMLGADDAAALLDRLVRETVDAGETIAAGWDGGGDLG